MEARKKVLLVTETGDSLRYWQESLPLLIRDVDLYYVSIRERGTLHDFTQKLIRPTFSLNCKSVLDYPLAILRLAGIVRSHQIEIIHASESVPAAIACLAKLVSRNVKIIFHRHHSSINARQHFFSALASHLSDLVMAVSKTAAKSAIESDKVKPSKVRVAYNGISEMRQVALDETLALRAQLRIPEDAIVLSLVSRLRKDKGHAILIKAAEVASVELGKTIHILFVGDGPEEQNIRLLSKTRSSIVVHFVGHQDDVAPWFSTADLVAIPSISESFGLTVVEAMSCARPLVASGVGGISEIIEHGISGILVEPGNPGALAEAISLVLKSRVLSIKLSQGGKERSRLFSRQSMVEGWRSCYELV